MSFLASEEKSLSLGEVAESLLTLQAYSAVRNLCIMAAGALFDYILNPFCVTFRTMRLVPEIILQFWRRQPNS